MCIVVPRAMHIVRVTREAQTNLKKKLIGTLTEHEHENIHASELKKNDTPHKF